LDQKEANGQKLRELREVGANKEQEEFKLNEELQNF